MVCVLQIIGLDLRVYLSRALVRQSYGDARRPMFLPALTVAETVGVAVGGVTVSSFAGVVEAEAMNVVVRFVWVTRWWPQVGYHD